MNALPAYKIYQEIALKASNLIVCWDNDAGRIGSNVFNCLSDSLKLSLFCEIEPNDFFTLGGVMVENNIAKFPESKIYYSTEKNIIVLYSTIPRFEWYKYISIVFDVVRKTCKVLGIYTVGGMISITAHTIPRVLIATVNKSELKLNLKNYDLSLNLDYETAPGHRPTMSSYMLWEAMRWNIMGVSLWVTVPFYLVGVDDLQASKKIIYFLNQKFTLNLDSSKLDKDLIKQTRDLATVIQQFPDIKELVSKLEANNSLTEVESGRLVEKMEECLKQIDND